MRIEVGNHSSYPGDDPLSAQVELGLDWITVHPRGAGDELTGIAAALAGASLGDPHTPPYRPTPCRRLRIQARLRNRIDGNRALLETCEGAARVAPAPLKLSLTGPYTLSRLAIIETTAYRSADHLAEDLANHLADQIRDAVRTGVRLVQVEEPELLRAPSDVRLVRDVLEPLQDAVEDRAALSIATYGAPVAGLFAQLNSLPGSIVAFDCLSSPQTIEDLAATGSGKPIALGLAAPGELPDAASIARRIERATHRYAHDVVYLQPASGLDSVDVSDARAVLEILAKARALVSGVDI